MRRKKTEEDENIKLKTKNGEYMSISYLSRRRKQKIFRMQQVDWSIDKR